MTDPTDRPAEHVSGWHTLAGRDWTTGAGVGVVGVAAIIASASAQTGLAEHAGWAWPMSALLPATVDVYGVTATRMWLSRASGPEVRRHARAHAITALAASITGNAIYHALEAGALVLGGYSWLLVVAVSIVPPLALGGLVHLVALRARAALELDDPAVPEDDPLRVQAAEVFADEVAEGRVPSIRSIRSIRETLRVGQSRAQRIRAYLAVLADQ